MKSARHVSLLCSVGLHYTFFSWLCVVNAAPGLPKCRGVAGLYTVTNQGAFGTFTKIQPPGTEVSSWDLCHGTIGLYESHYKLSRLPLYGLLDNILVCQENTLIRMTGVGVPQLCSIPDCKPDGTGKCPENKTMCSYCYKDGMKETALAILRERCDGLSVCRAPGTEYLFGNQCDYLLNDTGRMFSMDPDKQYYNYLRIFASYRCYVNYSNPFFYHPLGIPYSDQCGRFHLYHIGQRYNYNSLKSADSITKPDRKINKNFLSSGQFDFCSRYKDFDPAKTPDLVLLTSKNSTRRYHKHWYLPAIAADTFGTDISCPPGSYPHIFSKGTISTICNKNFSICSEVWSASREKCNPMLPKDVALQLANSCGDDYVCKPKWDILTEVKDFHQTQLPPNLCDKERIMRFAYNYTCKSPQCQAFGPYKTVLYRNWDRESGPILDDDGDALICGGSIYRTLQQLPHAWGISADEATELHCPAGLTLRVTSAKYNHGRSTFVGALVRIHALMGKKDNSSVVINIPTAPPGKTSKIDIKTQCEKPWSCQVKFVTHAQTKDLNAKNHSTLEYAINCTLPSMQRGARCPTTDGKCNFEQLKPKTAVRFFWDKALKDSKKRFPYPGISRFDTGGYPEPDCIDIGLQKLSLYDGKHVSSMHGAWYQGNKNVDVTGESCETWHSSFTDARENMMQKIAGGTHETTIGKDKIAYKKTHLFPNLMWKRMLDGKMPVENYCRSPIGKTDTTPSCWRNNYTTGFDYGYPMNCFLTCYPEMCNEYTRAIRRYYFADQTLTRTVTGKHCLPWKDTGMNNCRFPSDSRTSNVFAAGPNPFCYVRSMHKRHDQTFPLLGDAEPCFDCGLRPHIRIQESGIAKSHADAAKDCFRRGGRLAFISSHEVYALTLNYLRKLLYYSEFFATRIRLPWFRVNPNADKTYWVGLKRKKTKRKRVSSWKWGETVPVNAFVYSHVINFKQNDECYGLTAWKRMPDGVESAKLVQHYRFRSFSCSRKFRYLCEYYDDVVN